MSDSKQAKTVVYASQVKQREKKPKAESPTDANGNEIRVGDWFRFLGEPDRPHRVSNIYVRDADPAEGSGYFAVLNMYDGSRTTRCTPGIAPRFPQLVLVDLVDREPSRGK